jgi:hypothetical protein
MTDFSTASILSEPSFSSNNNNVNQNSSIIINNENSSVVTTADDLIAEAFLRCARIRTCFTVWNSKSKTRAKIYIASNQIATVFNKKFLLWRSLIKWRTKAEEQSRISNMSIVAWGWHARRSQRKALHAWRAFCDQAALRRERNRLALTEISYEADQTFRVSYFLQWLAFSSRCSAADSFFRIRTAKTLILVPSIKRWRHRLLKRRLNRVQVQFLQSRIQLQNALRFYDLWFLGVFASRRKMLLDYFAKLESYATWYYERKILLRRCFLSKWRPRTENLVADRFHRRCTLRTCLVQVWRNNKFEKQKKLRNSFESFENNQIQDRNRKMISNCFQNWRRRALQKNLLKMKLTERALAIQKEHFDHWKTKLANAREEKKWKSISSQVRRDFVLKKGFEGLIQSASKICTFTNASSLSKQINATQEHRDPNRTKSFFNRDDDDDNGGYVNQKEQEEIESSLRSLLSAFRNLQNSSGADQLILQDRTISDQSSIKINAVKRQQERERLRNLILRLRETLERISTSK